MYGSATLTVEEAEKKGLIKLSIKGKGGHLGDIVSMNIQNLSNKELELKIESGRILDSKSSSTQDILITQAREIYLVANELEALNIMGMGAEAHKAEPSEYTEFNIGKLGDSTLVKLAHFIDKNKLYKSNTAQQAVWTITDSKSIATINSGSKEEIAFFKNYVASITGQEIPNYTIVYKRQNTRDLLGSVSRVEGVFDYTIPEACYATLAIYNTAGELVQLIFKDIEHRKGKNSLYYTFKTANLPNGTYYAKMHLNGEFFKELKIDF